MDTAKDTTQSSTSVGKKIRRIGVALVVLLAAAYALFLAFFPKALLMKASPIEASAIYRTTVSAAKSLLVFEGLPHQSVEPVLLATELKRKDTTEIWNFPFYTPSIEATNADDLRKLLSNPASLAVYAGPKLCGGYHPDFCISWQAGKVKYYALICFGCHEIVLYDGKTSLIYDLETAAYKEFQQLLAQYRTKRPERIRNEPHSK